MADIARPALAEVLAKIASATAGDAWHECRNCGGRSPCEALRKIVEGD